MIDPLIHIDNAERALFTMGNLLQLNEPGSEVFCNTLMPEADTKNRDFTCVVLNNHFKSRGVNRQTRARREDYPVEFIDINRTYLITFYNVWFYTACFLNKLGQDGSEGIVMINQ